MANKRVLKIGFLLLVIFSSGITYITLNDQVRIRVDEDKATFYVPHEAYSWIWTVAGREETRLFDGTSLMNRDKKSINITQIINDTEVIIKRSTRYQRGPLIEESWEFDGKVDDVVLFPIDHQICVYNGTGKFLRYTVNDLTDVPEKEKICTGEKCSTISLSFGKNMKVNWQTENLRWAWIGLYYGSDSFTAQYDIPDNEECYKTRLFDPPVCGNNVIEESEQCDNGSNNDVPCNPEYDSECDYCRIDCTIETLSGGYCGDDILQESEETCDGNDLGDATCWDYPGRKDPGLKCNRQCNNYQQNNCDYTECNDNIDNDGDGYIDFQGQNYDPECETSSDDKEDGRDIIPVYTNTEFNFSTIIQDELNYSNVTFRGYNDSGYMRFRLWIDTYNSTPDEDGYTWKIEVDSPGRGKRKGQERNRDDLPGWYLFYIHPEELDNTNVSFGKNSTTISSSGGSSAATYPSYGNSLVIDSNNILHAVYISNGFDLGYSNSSTGSDTWSDTEIEVGTFEEATILVDSNNILYVIYKDSGDDIFVRNSTDFGGTWSNAIEWVTTSSSTASNNCAMDNNDNWHCCYTQATNGLFYYNSTQTGATNIYDNSLAGRACDIEVDYDNNVFITYAEGTTNDYWIFTTKNGDITNATSIIQPTNIPNPANGMGISISDSGEIFGCYINNSDLYVANSSTTNYGVWETLSRVETSTSFYCDAYKTRDGMYYTSRSSSTTSGSLTYYNSSDGVNWESTTLRSSTANHLSFEPTNFPSFNREAGLLRMTHTYNSDPYYDNLTVLFNDTYVPNILFIDPTPDNNDIVNKTEIFVNTTITDDTNIISVLDWNNTLAYYFTFEDFDATDVFGNDSSGTETLDYTTGTDSVIENYQSKFGNYLNISASAEPTTSTVDRCYGDLYEGGLTVSVWARNRGLGATDEFVDNNGPDFYGFFDPVDRICFYFRNTDGTYYTLCDTVDYADDVEEWHHVVAIWNQTANDTVLYHNGIQRQRKSTVKSVRCSSNKLRFGDGNGDVHIDEFMMFKRAINHDEIMALYNGTENRLFRNFSNLDDETNYTYRVCANDEGGNLVCESQSNFINTSYVPPTDGDDTAPTFSNAVNGSPNFRQEENFTANITVSDETSLNFTWFSTNNSGSWVNDTPIALNGITSYNFNNSKNISQTNGSVICWKVYANDSSGNLGESNQHCFTVQANATADSCSCPVSGDWTIDCSDSCNISADCDVQGNDLILDGLSGGDITISATIYNYANLLTIGGACVVHELSGGLLG